MQDAIENCAYLIGKRPRVTWAWDLSERNITFLRGIDGGYFTHVAISQGQLLETEDRQYAAAAIRVAYGQGLEALLALLAAAVQAPACPVGWMLGYRVEDLADVVRWVLEGGPNLASKKEEKLPTFQSLAAEVLSATPWEVEKRDRLAPRFGTLWRKWATEFLDDRVRAEYNSFKHGQRAALGGFSFAVGIEEVPGVPAAPEAMRSLGASEYGSTFFVREDLHEGRHHYPRRTSRNWNPVAMAHGLQLLAISIENVVSYLRIVSGDDPAQCRLLAPLDDETFELPWQRPGGMEFTTFDLVVRTEQIQKWTADEILSRMSGDDDA